MTIPGMRGPHHRVRELARRLVAGRERLLVAGVALDRGVRVAVQVGRHAGELLAQGGALRLRRLQVVPRLVVGGLRGEVVGGELLLPLELGRVVVDVRVGLADLVLEVPVAGLERVEVVAHDPELRVGALQRQPERLVVEAEQDVADGDLLVLADVDLLDDARHVGRDADHVRLHVGVLGRHVAPAGHVLVAADRERQRQGREQHRAEPAALGLRGCGRLGLRPACRFGRGLAGGRLGPDARASSPRSRRRGRRHRPRRPSAAPAGAPRRGPSSVPQPWLALRSSIGEPQARIRFVFMVHRVSSRRSRSSPATPARASARVSSPSSRIVSSAGRASGVR